MVEVPSLLTALAAVVLVVFAAAAHGWLRRAEPRREEVRRLAWHAAEEAEVAERAEAYCCGQHGGFVTASDIAEAPLLWTAPPSPPAPPAVGKGVCAMCGSRTTLRCKRCKSVKYCTFKCQIAHWREGHKDECNSPSVGARQDNTVKNVMAGVVPGVKGLPSDKESNTSEASVDGHGDDKFRLSQVTELAEAVDCSRFSTSSNSCRFNSATVLENLPHGQHAGLGSELEKPNKQALGPDSLESSRHVSCMSAVDKVPVTHNGSYHFAHNSSKRADSFSDLSVRSEAAGVVPNVLSTEKKNGRQQTAPKVMRHYSPELVKRTWHFVDLYNFKKVELHPFGLYNLGNSCYANAVLQCLTFTRPLTSYLSEGHHSLICPRVEWCFMCELEKLIVEGKRGKSPISPAGILSHLHRIGRSFGQGKEEDAHEFLRYSIDTMQSASMKEARINGVNRLSEETTLVQLIFGGYLQSKIKCTNCQVSSEQFERILDLTVEIDGDIGTLEDALRRFTSSEILDGDNRYYCSRCKSYERAKKKLTISEAPNVLTIALKRYQSGKFGKINKIIRFKEHLNLSDYMSASDDYTPVYKLYAVVVHCDVMNATTSGHYVCYVKDPQGNWHEMDDSKVKPISLEKVMSKCAYMLLYARCSPRAPSFVRKAMVSQCLSRAKNHKQLADSRLTSLGRSSYFKRYQGEQICKDHNLHDLAPTLETSDGCDQTPDFSRSDSSSLLSSSDAASTSTLSSDSTGSKMSSTSMEYDYIFGGLDQMCPVSAAIIPEEQELSYSRQCSSLSPSSSCQDMDQTGSFVQQNRAARRAWEESGGNTSFPYTGQGKNQDGGGGSSSSSSRHSLSRSCKLTERHRGVAGHGPREGRDGVLHRRPTRERTAQAFY